VLNEGAPGTYVTLGAKFTAPSSAMPEGWGFYLSGEAGHWFLGTTDNFFCTQVAATGCALPYPNGIPYHGYTTWNVGIGITKSVFTLDLRHYDTNYSKGDCAPSRATTRRASRATSPGSIRLGSGLRGAAQLSWRPASST
jgi:hypothetical protein